MKNKSKMIKYYYITKIEKETITKEDGTQETRERDERTITTFDTLEEVEDFIKSGLSKRRLIEYISKGVAVRDTFKIYVDRISESELTA